MTAQLLLRDGRDPLRTIVLHGQVYRIGRDPDAEVPVMHPAVSKRHALLELRQARWQLTDQGSTNGLSWQGRRVSWLELRDGDCIRLGPEADTSLPLLEFRDPAKSQPWRRLAKPLTAVILSLGSGALALLALGVLTVPVRGSLAPVRGPLVLYDRNNRVISSAQDSSHQEKPHLSDFSPALRRALLSSEDTRFWWHPGLDPIGTTRALMTNVIGGRVLEGGSTLTQQLARSLYPE